MKPQTKITLMLLAATLQAQTFARIPEAHPLFDWHARYTSLGGLPLSTGTMVFGDLNGDGHIDVVMAGNLDGPYILLNHGDGTLQLQRLPGATGAFSDGVALGDVDGDGDLDIVVGRALLTQGKTNLLYLNDGKGNFTLASPGMLPADQDATECVLLVDVDRDGDLDLVVGNLGQQNRLYLNDGKGNFTDATVSRFPGDVDHTVAVVSGDVNGDGWPDLVFANGFNYAAEANRLYLNDGKGGFYIASFPSIAEFTADIALGDVDGDGHLDVLFTNLTQTTRLYLNDGHGGFADASNQVPQDPRNISWNRQTVLADLDGDGDLDIALTTSDAYRQNLLIYVNDGKGNFTDETETLAPPAGFSKDHGWQIGAADLDGDGDLDLVFVDNGSLYRNNLTVYTNLRRQVYTQDKVTIGAPLTIYLHADQGHFVVPALSTRAVRIALPPFGTLGLDPSAGLVLPPRTIDRTRTALITLVVPPSPALRGVDLYTQALDMDLVNFGRSRFTNWIVDTIQ